MHEAAFLAQLREDPEDRDTFIVYADWLEEQGRLPQAEFLRAQHRLLGMRFGQRGAVPFSRRLLKLAQKLPQTWLDIVSRPRLEGTCWAGRNLNNLFYVFRYLPGGVLNYSSPSGKWQNGTWAQKGNHVTMEMNRHYADYEGFIVGDRIRGTGNNIAGGGPWRWNVTQTTDPELCDPTGANATIYDDHTRKDDQETDADA